MKYRWSSVTYLVVFLACVAAGIYLQGGWASIFISYMAPALILPAFLFLLFLSGGIDTTAMAMYDAFTVGAVDDRVDRYTTGLDSFSKTGRLLFLWGALGALMGFFIVISNLSEVFHIGIGASFLDLCIWMVFIVRAILVHPVIAALKVKTADAKSGGDASLTGPNGNRINLWIFVFLLFILPVSSILIFLAYGADVTIFLIPGATAFVPLAAISSCAMGVGFRRIATAFRTALDRKAHTEGEIDVSISVLKQLGLISLEMGAAGFVTKLTIMLAVLEDPKAILGSFTLGLVPVFYGIFFAAVFCFPLVSRLALMKNGRKSNRGLNSV